MGKIVKSVEERVVALDCLLKIVSMKILKFWKKEMNIVFGTNLKVLSNNIVAFIPPEGSNYSL